MAFVWNTDSFIASSIEAGYYTLGILMYSLLVYFLYKAAGKGDLIKLDLSKYKKGEHQILGKIWGSIIYVVEFIGIFPFIAFGWFSIYAAMIAWVAPSLGVEKILLISVGLISAVRVCAHLLPDLSHDLAKMVPLAILGSFLATGTFTPITELGTLFVGSTVYLNSALYYFLFFIALEVVARFLKFSIELTGN